MSLLTESSLRALFKHEIPKHLVIKKGDILTPSARQFLKDRGVELSQEDALIDLVKDRPVVENHYKPFTPMSEAGQPKFVSYYDGGFYATKPEHMTHLKGNKLVYKDHPRIVFRGKIDSLQSTLIETQLYVLGHQKIKLVHELDTILEFVRQLLRAEVLDLDIQIEKLLELDEDELREHSHFPKKYYGIEHFVPDVSMGLEVVLLNKIRTQVREVELEALKTFRREGQVERADIVKVLNRLSSAIYIMMCRARGGYYD